MQRSVFLLRIHANIHMIISDNALAKFQYIFIVKNIMS